MRRRYEHASFRAQTLHNNHGGQHQVNRLEITFDKSLLAAAGNPQIRMYDVASNNPQPVMTYDGHTSNVTSIGFQRDRLNNVIASSLCKLPTSRYPTTANGCTLALRTELCVFGTCVHLAASATTRASTRSIPLHCMPTRENSSLVSCTTVCIMLNKPRILCMDLLYLLHVVHTKGIARAASRFGTWLPMPAAVSWCPRLMSPCGMLRGLVF